MFTDAQELVTRAMEATGLSDMGLDGWQEGLDALVHAVQVDVGHDPEAVARIDAIVHQRLVTRLRIEAWFVAHGDEAAHPVEGPLVIVGLPRTATTATHYLLANDPAMRYVRRWERDEPLPPPDLATEHEDPRRPAEAPDGGVMHIATVDGPAEDGPIHALHFHAETGLPLPTYMTWWRSADHRSSFAYHDRFLRMLHSHRPPHHWLLKYPNYAYQVRDIVAQYPGAKFVMTHRDPVKLVPSTCSVMVDARRKRIPGWSPEDPRAFGLEILEHNAEAVRRLAAARAELGDDRFVDVAQREMEADPVAVAERIYAFAGRTLTDDVRTVMGNWATSNRRGSRGEHRYTADEFGLSEGEIQTAFAEYLDEYGSLCR